MGVKASNIVTYQKRAYRRRGVSSQRQLFALFRLPAKIKLNCPANPTLAAQGHRVTSRVSPSPSCPSRRTQFGDIASLATLHTSFIAIPRLPDKLDADSMSALALDIDLIVEIVCMETTPLDELGNLRGGSTHGAGLDTSLQDQQVVAKVSRHLLWFLFVLFFFLVFGSDQYRIRRPDHDERSGAFRNPVWFGHDVVLHRLYCVRHSEQHRVGAYRFEEMDRHYHDRVGLASTATMFASSPGTLYLLRVLVGVTEAGFLPGILLYMTFWFPSAYRARANALFMIAMPATAAVGSALSGYILALDGTLGLRGWQWLFFLEGLPSVILGLIVFTYLDDAPGKRPGSTSMKSVCCRTRSPRSTGPTPYRAYR